MREFEELLRQSFSTVTIDQADYALATTMTGQADAGIRAGDALHLAVSHRHNAPLVTFDKRLAAGATTLGYAVELIA